MSVPTSRGSAAMRRSSRISVRIRESCTISSTASAISPADADETGAVGDTGGLAHRRGTVVTGCRLQRSSQQLSTGAQQRERRAQLVARIHHEATLESKRIGQRAHRPPRHPRCDEHRSDRCKNPGDGQGPAEPREFLLAFVQADCDLTPCRARPLKFGSHSFDRSRPVCSAPHHPSCARCGWPPRQVARAADLGRPAPLGRRRSQRTLRAAHRGASR